MDGSPTAPPFLDAARLAALVPHPVALEALSEAFAERSEDGAPLRTHVPLPGGELLLMPALGPGGVGVKLLGLQPGNAAAGLPLIQGVFVLFSAATLTPELIIDGAALTALRTAAVSALATRRLSREDSRRLVVFGAGVQAAAHVDAILAVRPIERVAIVAPTRRRDEALVSLLRQRGLDAVRAGPEAVAEADIVCTCTTSPEPVLDGRDVAPGTHVNAIGAYAPDRRELDSRLLTRATIVVESRRAALAEAGDLIQALSEEAITLSSIAGDLCDVVSGRLARSAPEEVTVFKSVGLAVEDLAVARAAHRRLTAT